MKIPVYNQNAESVGEVELNSKIFEVEPSQHLLAEAVRVTLANARGGNSNTKTRGEVRGGGKKPWKQKGTGRARAGSIRSPIWRSGGITFGPRANRNWSLKMNQKARTQALFMALSDKAKDGKFVVIKEVRLDQPKTSEMAKVLKSFEGKVKEIGKKKLFLMPKMDEGLFRASRNITNLQSLLANQLNAYEVMKSDSIIALEGSLPVIEKTFLKNPKLQGQKAK